MCDPPTLRLNSDWCINSAANFSKNSYESNHDKDLPTGWMGCRSRRFSPSHSSLTCVRFLKGSLGIWDLTEGKSRFGETQNVLTWRGISLVLGKQDSPKSWRGMWYWEKYDFQDRADTSLGCEIVLKKELECRIRTLLSDLVVSIKDDGQLV